MRKLLRQRGGRACPPGPRAGLVSGRGRGKPSSWALHLASARNAEEAKATESESSADEETFEHYGHSFSEDEEEAAPHTPDDNRAVFEESSNVEVSHAEVREDAELGNADGRGEPSKTPWKLTFKGNCVLFLASKEALRESKAPFFISPFRDLPHDVPGSETMEVMKMERTKLRTYRVSDGFTTTNVPCSVFAVCDQDVPLERAEGVSSICNIAYQSLLFERGHRSVAEMMQDLSNILPFEVSSVFGYCPNNVNLPVEILHVVENGPGMTVMVCFFYSYFCRAHYVNCGLL